MLYYSNTVKKEGDTLVYVMADIHGNSRRFNSILQQINLQPEDTLYVLGDVVDRHGDGVRILRRLMAMPNAKVLLGNHEYMMLQTLGQPYPGEVQANPEESRFLWYRNGGEVTHRYWKHIRKTLRAEVIAYLHSLPLSFDVTVGGTNYKLVHGSVQEDYTEPGGKYKSPTHYAVWKRLEKEDMQPRAEVTVFGHTPTKHYRYADPLEVYFSEHYIGIDCGSGYPDRPEDEFSPQGRLACLRLDDQMVFYSEENT